MMSEDTLLAEGDVIGCTYNEGLRKSMSLHILRFLRRFKRYILEIREKVEVL